MAPGKSRKQGPVGKWIEGLDPAMPVSAAAEIVVEARLRGVEMMLPLAAERWEDDVEYVHQLRVCTRRSAAAMHAFAACFDPERLRTVRRHLKKVRRAAGEARTCDVFDEAFRTERADAPKSHRRFLDDLIAWNADARRAAQKHLRKAQKRHPVKDLAKARRKLLRSIVAPSPGDAPTTMRQHAATILPDLLKDVRDAAGADLDIIENLHQLRIVGKRLRYAMELFSCCYGDHFKEAYGRITSLQQRLGAINDSEEFTALIERFIEARAGDVPGLEWTAGGEAVLAEHRRMSAERVASFLGEWRGGAWEDLFQLAALDGRPGAEPDVGAAVNRGLAADPPAPRDGVEVPP